MHEFKDTGAQIYRYYVRLLHEIRGWSPQETDRWIDSADLRGGLDGIDPNFFTEPPESYILSAIVPIDRLRELEPNESLRIRAVISDAARNSHGYSKKSFDDIDVPIVSKAICDALHSNGLSNA